MKPLVQMLPDSGTEKQAIAFCGAKSSTVSLADTPSDEEVKEAALRKFKEEHGER